MKQSPWTIDDYFLTRPLQQISEKVYTKSFSKKLKMSSAKRQPFCSQASMWSNQGRIND